MQIQFLESTFENIRHTSLPKSGLVFVTKESAEAMAKSLLNYKVEVKNEWVD
ncbi:hypothetical protein ACU6T4_03155 [Avibacterium paragallinarum]|uniref:hypothetical protein n=1 Tax=Avibacterium paragallinarum TaxID=728 RepID=UPI00021AD21C|nr:hypothetical protein [Avibacterium paragallinarum]QIR11314.1 hypothetical protein HBL79_03075 [Avibacterium paragallinarum]QJE09866.1 hypothetical protein HHJ62_05950 [Avibacterium paragallinarum]QJE12062.1 hypothetical protein HHJ61_05955 [Avibacterium paragallinarum]QJE14263.1 hypothetical protein HHJ60_05970 [Avibacterium paragallinarum]QJE16463.1 hypothetical protein HHJ59_05960 [Avibacterium paragallinarum]